MWLRVLLFSALFGPNAMDAPLLAAARSARNSLPNKVGVVTRDYTPTQRRNWRGAEVHSFHTVVWYPAVDTAVETLQTIGPSDAPLFLAGSTMPHAPFAPALEKLPLVVLSPDVGTSAEGMAWLGTALARAGFLAIAVDPPGAGPEQADTAEGLVLWWERATDITEVLDALLADPELGEHVDRERIGAAGVGLGAFTSLQLGGARTDISLYYDRCRQQADTAVCKLVKGHGFGSPEDLLAAARKTGAESLARSGDSFGDVRVKAVLALAPELGFTFTTESLRGMRVPVQMVSGAADVLAPVAEDGNYLRGNLRGARSVVLPNVGHGAFFAECTAAGKQTSPQRCEDGPGVDRRAVHEQAGALAVDFFGHALR